MRSGLVKDNQPRLPRRARPAPCAELSGCYNVATAALNRAKLDNIQTTRSQVSGTVDDTVFVAVTCVGTRPQPTAVVMATSELSSDAQDARNTVLRFIRK